MHSKNTNHHGQSERNYSGTVVIHHRPHYSYYGYHSANGVAFLLLLVFILTIAVVVMVTIAYHCYKRLKRREHEDLLKEVKTEVKDVQLSTSLMKEKNIETSGSLKANVPTIRVQKPSIEGGGFLLLPESSDERSTSSDED